MTKPAPKAEAHGGNSMTNIFDGADKPADLTINKNSSFKGFDPKKSPSRVPARHDRSQPPRPGSSTVNVVHPKPRDEINEMLGKADKRNPGKEGEFWYNLYEVLQQRIAKRVSSIRSIFEVPVDEAECTIRRRKIRRKR